MSTVISEVVKKIPTPAQIGNVKYRFKKPNNGWGKYYEKLKEIAKALGKELSDFHPSTGPALIPIPGEENVFRFKRMAGMWNLKTGAVSEPMVKISGEDIVDFALEFEQLDSTLNSLDEFVKTAMQLNVSHGFFQFNDETQTYNVRDAYYFKPAPPKIIDVKTLDLAALRKCFSEFINTDAMQITVKSSLTYLSIPREEAFKFVLAKRDKAAGSDSKGDVKSDREVRAIQTVEGSSSAAATVSPKPVESAVHKDAGDSKRGHEAITAAFNAKRDGDPIAEFLERYQSDKSEIAEFLKKYEPKKNELPLHAMMNEMPPKKDENEIVKLLKAYEAEATEKSFMPKP